MMLLTLTPEGFQSVVMAWLAVVSAVVVAVTGLVIFLVPKVTDAIQKITEAWKTIKQTQDQNIARLNRQGDKIEKVNDKMVDLARALPPKDTL